MYNTNFNALNTTDSTVLTHKYSSYQLVWLTPENLSNGDRKLLIISTKSSDAYYTIVTVTQTSDEIKVATPDTGYM